LGYCSRWSRRFPQGDFAALNKSAHPDLSLALLSPIPFSQESAVSPRGVMILSYSMIITRLSKASWFKVTATNHVIHFDPGYAGYFENQGIPENELAEKADLVLVSHFHKDHLQAEALNRIVDADTIIIAPESCANRIDHEITIIKPNEKLTAKGIQIKAIDAYNTPEGRSTRKVHHKGDFVGYLVSLEGKIIYHAGDTDLIPEMGTLGNVDIAFLPIGGTYVMDAAEAVQAVKVINPAIVIPMHEARNDLTAFEKEVTKTTDSGSAMILTCGETIGI